MMGRELKRKEAKRKNTNIKENVEEKKTKPKEEVYKMMKILTIVLFVLVGIYLIVGIFITKEIKFGSKNKNEDTTQTSTSNILASEIFKQPEEEYFVYFYDFNKTLDNIESAMTSKLYNYKIYRVDTSSGFNSKYVSTESNVNATKLEELKVLEPTLILIKNDSIEKYVETDNGILNYING